MKYSEAINMTSYKHSCSCGFFAGHYWNDLKAHAHFCPQKKEYEEREEALKHPPETTESFRINVDQDGTEFTISSPQFPFIFVSDKQKHKALMRFLKQMSDNIEVDFQLERMDNRGKR